MSRHFNASVLLERPWRLDMDVIASAVRRAFPEIGRVDAVIGQGAGLASGILSVDGGQVVVTCSDMPCDPRYYTPKLKVMRAWDSTDAIARHPAHMTISCGGTLGGLDGAEAYAAAVHLVAAAIIPIVPAAGIVWHDSFAVSEPQAFIDATQSLLKGSMPLGAWVSFASVVPRGFPKGSATGMVTYGMRPFLGRELELAPRPCRPADAYRCLSAIAHQTLDRGLELIDGQRLIEEGGGYDVTVRERNYWLRRDLSAFVLVSPDSVVDVESLRPRHRVAA